MGYTHAHHIHRYILNTEQFLRDVCGLIIRKLGYSPIERKYLLVDLQGRGIIGPEEMPIVVWRQRKRPSTKMRSP